MGLRNGTKVVLFFTISSALLGFTQVPIVSATSTSNPSLFEILSSGDITFVGGGSTEKMIVIGVADLLIITNFGPTLVSENGETYQIIFSSAIAYAPVDVPDGATITEFECIVKDNDNDYFINCSLFENAHGSLTANLLSSISTTIDSNSFQTLTDSSLNEPVDRDPNRYYVSFKIDTEQEPNDCNSCFLASFKITYTVPSSGITVGGEFIPVDNVSLVLAYGLVNSWWMAPTAVGIGLGIYLVKRRF